MDKIVISDTKNILVIQSISQGCYFTLGVLLIHLMWSVFLVWSLRLLMYFLKLDINFKRSLQLLCLVLIPFYFLLKTTGYLIDIVVKQ
jgi:hypothetical protein